MPQLRPRLLLDSCLGRNFPRPHDKAAALADSARAPNFPQSFQLALCRRAAVISRSCSSTDSGTSQLSHSSKREDMLGALKQSSVRSTCRKDLPRHQVHPRRDLTTLAHCSSIARLACYLPACAETRQPSLFPYLPQTRYQHDTSKVQQGCKQLDPGKTFAQKEHLALGASSSIVGLGYPCHTGLPRAVTVRAIKFYSL